MNNVFVLARVMGVEACVVCLHTGTSLAQSQGVFVFTTGSCEGARASNQLERDGSG